MDLFISGIHFFYLSLLFRVIRLPNLLTACLISDKSPIEASEDEESESEEETDDQDSEASESVGSDSSEGSSRAFGVSQKMVCSIP